MIAVSSKGRSFRALATYLATGRTGQERERVAWSTARNLPTNDPELAGKIMRATAERSTRVEQPVYHLVLSFDPTDQPDRATMERVAERVLERIQLHEHQAVIVAHRDREHAHVHILVNRVHPETGRVWEYSFDYRAIQEVLREEERALGIRQVPGRYRDHGIHRAMDDGAEVGTAVERAIAVAPERDRAIHLAAAGRETGHAAEPFFDAGTAPIPTGESALCPAPDRAHPEPGAGPLDPMVIDRARARLPELRAATSWAEFEAVLAADGLSVEAKGQGLAVTDGERSIKASVISRDLARGRLEARFEKAWSSYVAERIAAIEAEIPRGNGDAVEVSLRRATGPSTVGNRITSLRAQLEAYEQAAALQEEHYLAAQGLNAARARVSQLDIAEGRARVTAERFGRALSAAYCDPGAARVAFERVAKERGVAAAVEDMRRHPEQFGELLIAEDSRAFGLLRIGSDVRAREAVLSAAVCGKEAWNARFAVPAAAESREIRESALRVIEHERTLGEAVRRGPEKRALERDIAFAVRRLVPHELAELQRTLTRPQFAIAVKLREAVRDAVLGRDGPE